MSRRLKKERNEAEVNMTPMLDIVFIMLIFFIVTSSFVRESGLDVTQPNSNDKKEDQPKKARAILVKVCADENIFIDNRGIDVRSVRANIEKKLAENSRSVVIVQTEHEAETGTLVEVMDQAREARATVSIQPLDGGCELTAT